MTSKPFRVFRLQETEKQAEITPGLFLLNNPIL